MPEQTGGDQLNSQRPTEPTPTRSEVVSFTRSQAADCMRKGEPIYITRREYNGDDMICMWANYVALKQLAQEENIEEPFIELATFDPDQPQDSNKQPFLLSRAIEGIPVMASPRVVNEKHFYRKQLLKASLALGVTIPQEEFDKPPQPFKTDRGPHANFDKEKILQEGESLRKQILDQGFEKIVVIAQSGSEAEKRLNDAQVARLATLVRQKNPNSYIIAVSDKLFLQDIMPAPTTSQADFPWGSDEFRNEAANINQPFGTDVNTTVLSRDINEILTQFAAADTEIGTDSFWSWEAGGTKAMVHESQNQPATITNQEIITLHTTAHPDYWGVTGATHVTSGVLSSTTYALDRNGQIPNTADYYDYHLLHAQQKTPRPIINVRRNTNDPRRAVQPEDMAKLETAIQTSSI